MERRADLGVGTALGEHAQYFPLALRERLADIGAPARRERGSKNRVDVEATRRDGVDRTPEILERRILQREAACPGVERLGDEPLVGDAGVEQNCCLRDELG